MAVYTRRCSNGVSRWASRRNKPHDQHIDLCGWMDRVHGSRSEKGGRALTNRMVSSSRWMLTMIDWREIADSDTWELFARDFLAQLGFVIEVGPGSKRRSEKGENTH